MELNDIAKDMLHYAATHLFAGKARDFARELPRGLTLVCLIAKSLPGYAYREPQLFMARLVELAARTEQKLVVEAGTSTGKSLAYLAPLILLGQKIIVSTANKAQQLRLPLQSHVAAGRDEMPMPELAAWYAQSTTGDTDEFDGVITAEHREQMV